MDAHRQHTIELPNLGIEQRARERQNQLIKPQGALGKLETVACWFAARQHRVIPETLKPAVLVFAADHGVARQGVSAYPASVTTHMVESLARGVAAINVLAKVCAASIDVIDVGVNQASAHPNVNNERIGAGTKDLSVGPAMTIAQAEQALQIGRRYALHVIQNGANLIVAGEVGIANTTSAACLLSVLLRIDAEQLVGNGTGISHAVRIHKVQIVRSAVQRIGEPQSPWAVLAECGGFEIAAMAGAYLEAARSGVPCVLDGFISAAAAVVACALEPNVRHWLLASHRSAERGHALALEQLGLEPLLDLGMRLGEGSGAAAVIPLLQAAIKLHAEMATFAEAGVPDGSDNVMK
jgi:nicotinate-nucleotide--dimethylbenzimidazole phosphoribosyltransferase